MLFAFLTTILFSFSAPFANRSIRHLGSNRANLYRLLLAAGCLAVVAHCFGQGVGGPAFWWFFLSGCVGFGIGDLALFFAFPRLGTRLTILLTQCLSAPLAAAAEWTWLGTRVSWTEAACSSVILAGVALALAPGKLDPVRRAVFIAGLAAGLVSAFGQGFGAVVSRKAYNVTESAGIKVDGMTAAYQRVLGGILVTGLALLTIRARTPALNPATPLHSPATNAGEPAVAAAAPRGPAWPWVVANALTGPVLGVACFQWALATTKSAVVLPIVALTPIAVMPLAYFLEHDRPTVRGVSGGVIAVAGAIGLTLAR